jgi:hypothetical protein
MKVATSITLPIIIKNGKFASNFNMLGKIFDHYEGFTIDVTFKKRTNKRSVEQNSYYWGVIIPIIQNCVVDQCGEVWSGQKVHELLLGKFNTEELINTSTGETVIKTRSTTENTTVQQEAYHEHCRRFCLEFFNTIIELPDKDLKLEFNK